MAHSEKENIFLTTNQKKRAKKKETNRHKTAKMSSPNEWEEGPDDVMQDMQANSLENGLFGVFYTIAREKKKKAKKWVLATIFVEFLQMIALSLNPSFGWAPEIENIWKFVGKFAIKNPLVSLGYNYYVAGFAICAFVLISSLVICALVAHHFKTNSFPYVWPVKFVRTVFAIFIGVFFLSTLQIFLVSLACDSETFQVTESSSISTSTSALSSSTSGTEISSPTTNVTTTRLVLTNFETIQCWEMPHLIVAGLGIICSILLSVSALGIALISFEPNMDTDDLLASAVGRQQFQEYVLKMCLSCAESLLGKYPVIQAGVFLAATALMTFDLIHFVPFYHKWINMLNTGLLSVVVWCSLVLFLKQMWSVGIEKPAMMTWIVLGGAPVAFCIGWVMMWLRLRSLDGTFMIEQKRLSHGGHHHTTADAPPTPNGSSSRRGDLRRSNTTQNNNGQAAVPMPDDDTVVIVVTKEFVSELHPEVAVRFVQGHADNPRVVAAGSALLQQAVLQYPESAAVHIVYASYILAYDKDRPDRAQMMLDKARGMRPSFLDRYCLFLRDRERKQRLQAATTGESAMDLVSYIEFQSKFKIAVNSYKGTLRAIRAFWKIVAANDVTMALMSDAFSVIDAHQDRAERTYQSLLENYPKSVAALRSFARFCEDIKGDMGQAHKYNAEADKQEDLAAEARRKRAQDMGAGAVDDKVDATIVASSVGTITFVNNIACKMFGWKKDDLMGRNLSVLMPSPIAEQHDSFLKKYMETGKSAILGNTRVMEGQHKQGHTFSVRVGVSRVESASGVSFIGVLRPTNEEESHRLTINAFGIMQSCTKGVPLMFGYKSVDDLVGRNVQILMDPAINHDSFLRYRRERGHDAHIDFGSRRLLGRRADGSDFPMSVSISKQGDEGDSMVFVGILRELNDGIGIVSTNETGVVLTANKQAGDLFGYTNNSLIGQNVIKLMPPPYHKFHDFWLKRFKDTGVTSIMGRGRRALVKHKDGSLFEVSLDVGVNETGGKRTYLARITNCDSRVDEARRTDSTTACTLALSGEFSVKSVAGGAGHMFGEKDPMLMIGWEFSSLFVEADVQPDTIADTEGGMVLTPALRLGDVGEPTVVQCVPVGDESEEEEYRLLMYTLSALEAVMGIRTDGTVTYVNESAKLLFGRRELIGEKILSLFVAESCKVLFTPESLELIASNKSKGFKESTGRKAATLIRGGDRNSVSVIIEAGLCEEPAWGGAQVALRITTVSVHGIGEEWTPKIRNSSSPASPRVRFMSKDRSMSTTDMWKHVEIKDGNGPAKDAAAPGAVVAGRGAASSSVSPRHGMRSSVSPRSGLASASSSPKNLIKESSSRRSSVNGGGDSESVDEPIKRTTKQKGSDKSSAMMSPGRAQPSLDVLLDNSDPDATLPVALTPRTMTSVLEEANLTADNAFGDLSKEEQQGAKEAQKGRKSVPLKRSDSLGSTSSSRGKTTRGEEPSSQQQQQPRPLQRDPFSPSVPSSSESGETRPMETPLSATIEVNSGTIASAVPTPTNFFRNVDRLLIEGGKKSSYPHGKKSGKHGDSADDSSSISSSSSSDLSSSDSGIGPLKSSVKKKAFAGPPRKRPDVPLRLGSNRDNWSLDIPGVVPRATATTVSASPPFVHDDQDDEEEGYRRTLANSTPLPQEHNYVLPSKRRTRMISKLSMPDEALSPGDSQDKGSWSATVAVIQPSQSKFGNLINKSNKVSPFEEFSDNRQQQVGPRYPSTRKMSPETDNYVSTRALGLDDDNDSIDFGPTPTEALSRAPSGGIHHPNEFLVSPRQADVIGREQFHRDEGDDYDDISDSGSQSSKSSTGSSINSTSSMHSTASSFGEGGDMSKRFKRVARALRLNRIRRVVKIMQKRVWTGIGLILIVEIVFFAVLRTYLADYLNGTGRMVLAGQAAHHTQLIATIATRSPFSTQKQLLEYADMIEDSATVTETVLHQLYLSSKAALGSEMRALFDEPKMRVIQLVDGPTPFMTENYMGLWNFADQYLQSAREFAVRLRKTDPIVSYAMLSSWRFILDNGPEHLCPTLSYAGTLEKDQWVGDLGGLHIMNGVLIAAEIALVFILWAFVITPAFNSVFFERMKIFGYFLAIPPGVVLKLATASIMIDELGDEDEDDDYDDDQQPADNNNNQEENGGGGGDSNEKGGTIAAGFDTSGGNKNQLDSQVQSRGNNNNGDQHHQGEEDGGRGPSRAHGRRKSMTGRKQKRSTSRAARWADERSDDGDDNNNNNNNRNGNNNNEAAPRQRRLGQRIKRAFTQFGSRSRRMFRRTRRNVMKAILRIGEHFFGHRIQPLPTNGRRARRRPLIIGSDRYRRIMSAPMLAVAVLLSVSLALSIVYLQWSQEPSIDLNGTETRIYLALRTHHLCERLVDHPTERSAIRVLLNTTLSQLRDVHTTLTSSSAFRSKLHSSLLFDDGCLRQNPIDCRPISDPYYARVSHGLNQLLESFMISAKSLNEMPEPFNSTNATPWLFIDSVAWTDLLDGMLTSVDRTLDEARLLAPADAVGQSLIFVGVIGALVVLFFGAYKPFERRTISETKRATMMLTLLPDYIDLSSLT